MSDRGSEQQSKLNWEIGRSILTGKIEANHLYYEQFEMVKACCEEAARMLAGSKDRDEDRLGDFPKDAYTRDRNTVIGVVGERGSGKTSFLYSLKESLDKEYCVLDVVDPSDFDSGMSVLELFLAQMFNEYKKLYPEYEERHGELFALPIHSNFKDLAKTLSALRTDGSVYSCENPSIEVLANMADRMAVRENIRDLCKNFLHLVNGLGEGEKKPCIVLLVDDVDLAENEHVYRMLDDVRKFLSGNIIVVLSYRESQLLDSVVDRKIKENERLIGKEVISLEEVRKQASRLVSKLLPENRVVRLYDQSDLLGRRVSEVLKALGPEEALKEKLIDRYMGVARFGKKASAGDGDASSVTVEDWINDVVYANTLIKMDPVFGLEKSAYAYPESLRELVGFVEMIQLEMEVPPVPEGDRSKDSSYYKIYHKNLQRYRKYLLSRLSVALGNTYIDMIIQWTIASTEAKNHYVYKIASGLLEECKDELAKRDLLTIDLMLPENVTIGDVSDVLGRLCRVYSNDSQIVFFCYVMKVLYSIELLDSLLTALLGTLDGTEGSPEHQKAVDEYLTLVNACIIPPEAFGGDAISEMRYPSFKESELSKDKRSGEKWSDREAYPWFIALFGILASTNYSVSSRTLRNSRPHRGFEDRSYFEDKHNRPLFFVDPDGLLCEEGIEVVPGSVPPEEGQTVAFEEGQTYWISPFNMLAKKEYVIQSLRKIAKGEGAYLFYLLFDIDVFRRMTFDLKGKKSDAMEMCLKRLNAAVLYPYWRSIGVAEPKISNGLMEIRNGHETSLLQELGATFVVDEDYRLFGEEGSSSLSSISLISKVYRLSLAEDAAFKKEKRAAREFVEDKRNGKNVIRPIVERFYAMVEDIAMEDELTAVRDMFDHWDVSKNGVQSGQRERLKALLEEYPHRFVAAYREITRNEQR